MKRILILFFLAAYCIAAWANQNRITARGTGPNRGEALMVAQRNAVESGVGVLVDSQTLTKNLMLVEDSIFAKSRGYIKNYTVVSETRLKDGNWEVMIQCEVAEEKIKHSLNALGILRDKIGNPRIMVVYDPSITDGIPQKSHPIVSQAYEGIMEYLAEREFPIVDKKVFGQSILNEFPIAKMSHKKSVEPGLRKKAEYILAYTIKPGDRDSTVLFKKGWVMISAKIIDTASGQLLAAQSKKVIGVDKESFDFAYRKAARKAGSLAAKFLENKLVKRWSGNTVSGRPVVLELVNIKGFSLLMEFRAKLKKAFGVKSILLRNSTTGTALYEITYVGGIDTLKEEAYKILKKIGAKPGIPVSFGDRIRFELSGK